jgi:hypothetical protein
MMDMLGAVVPLEILKARASVTELLIATDRGANAFDAAALLRGELRSLGFPGGSNGLQVSQGEAGSERLHRANPGSSSGHRLLDEVRVVRSAVIEFSGKWVQSPSLVAAHRQ